MSEEGARHAMISQNMGKTRGAQSLHFVGEVKGLRSHDIAQQVDAPHFLIKNSWGEGWGYEGHAKIGLGYEIGILNGTCGMMV